MDHPGTLILFLRRLRAAESQRGWSARHIDLEGHFIRANKQLCEAVRYDREELLRKTFDDITHPDDLQSNRDRMRLLLSGEIDEYSMDKRCVRKDGSHLWVNLNVSLVRHASGEPWYFVTVVENIDERKKAEMILRSLTPREAEVLKLLAHGLTNRQIARELYISANTAKFHVQHVIEKLGVADRTQAAYRAAELSLVVN